MLLALDTSSDYVSLALFDDNKPVAHIHQNMVTGQAESLFPMLQDLFKKANVSSKDLSCIAVAVGPGSFTGVRIALATARAFALALNIPVIGITNFEAAAYNIKQPVTVVLNTKRGDFFVQDFDAEGHPTCPAKIQTSEQLAKRSPFNATGSGVELLAKTVHCTPISSGLSEAEAVGYVALTRPQSHLPAVPIYLREADVTV